MNPLFSGIIIRFPYSHFNQTRDLFFILFSVHLGQGLERLIDSLILEGAHFEEFKADILGEHCTVLGGYLCPIFEVDLVGDDDSGHGSAWVLLFDSFVPLSEELESVGIGHIIHQHNQIGLP